jgi:hypothetical protein
MEALCQDYEQKLADARSEIVRTNQGNLKSSSNILDDESTLKTSATEHELAELKLLLSQKQTDMEALCQDYEQKLADAHSESVRKAQNLMNIRERKNKDKELMTWTKVLLPGTHRLLIADTNWIADVGTMKPNGIGLGTLIQMTDNLPAHLWLYIPYLVLQEVKDLRYKRTAEPSAKKNCKDIIAYLVNTTFHQCIVQHVGMISENTRKAIAYENVVDNKIMLIILELSRLPLQVPVVLTSDKEFIVKLNSANIPSSSEVKLECLLSWVRNRNLLYWID